MRIIRHHHVLLLVILGMVMWYAWPQLSLLQGQAGGRTVDQLRLAASYSSIGYVLDREQWTRFPVNPALQSIRLVSNATIPADAAVGGTDVEWGYAIQIQFLDRKHRILRDHVHYYRSKVTWFEDRRFSGPITSSFFIDPKMQPTDGRVSLISLRGLPEVASIRVRIAAMDPGVRDVVLRVYAPERVPEHKLAAAWSRLSPEQRKSLARGNVYDIDLLTEEERKNLVRRRWVGVGPAGVAGQHYRIRKIYTFRDIEGIELAQPVPPFGLYLSDTRHGVIPIPDGGGHVLLRFEGMDIDDDAAGLLKLRWMDPGGRVFRTFEEKWKGTRHLVEMDLDAGTLEIVSNREGAVRVFVMRHGQQQEITPSYPYLAIYLTGEESVRFGVHHVQGQPTVMRFDVRRVWLEGAPDACSGVDYRLLDRSGRELARGTMNAPVSPSAYDIMTGGWSDSRVSDPIRHYLWLPADVASVAFSSVCPLGVNGYDRPHGFVWTTHVPEDYDVARTLDLKSRIPGWFSVRPVNLKSLLLRNRTPLIQVQIHPRAEEEVRALMAGQYHWQDYHPEGRHHARWLLVPRESPLPPRKQSLPGFYLRLEQGREIEVVLDSETGVMRPNLIFIRTTARAGRISLRVDGRSYAHLDVAGLVGEIRLPPLKAGRHRLLLQADQTTTCYISHANAMEHVYIKRLVYPVGKTPLSFVIEKSAAEKDKVLSARLFMPAGRLLPARVHVSIAGAKRPFYRRLDGWTFVERVFVVAPPEQIERAPVLGKAGMYMDMGQSFFIPLRADLPPGRYVISLDLEQGAQGFVALTNVLPGVYEERQMVEEAAIENAVDY